LTRSLVRRYGYEPINFTPDGSGTTLNLLDPTILKGTGLQGQARLLNIGPSPSSRLLILSSLG
jgi:hypothetical protein